MYLHIPIIVQTVTTQIFIGSKKIFQIKAAEKEHCMTSGMVPCGFRDN
jgi:hypothetical protein